MAAPEPEFHFELDTAPDSRLQWRSRIASLILHALGLLILLNVRFEPTPVRANLPEITVRRVTPLVAPPPQVLRELTQKAPNTKEVAKEIDLAGLLPKREIKAPPARSALSPRPSPGVPQSPSLPSAPQIELPQTAMAQLPPQGAGDSKLPPPPAPEPPQQKPKITFESVASSGTGAGNTRGGPAADVKLPVPTRTVDEAVSAVARRSNRGGLTVGDELDPPSIGQSMSQHAAPGKMGSALELLSDPQGADFRPYLIRVLTAVRRNWFAVIPESARLGREGRVLIQFSIARDGRVPKLVIAMPSGADPLDRAAVAGISASNPFPPLPSDFKGDQIRVQLSFVYNQRR